jgi:hypothetical protein
VKDPLELTPLSDFDALADSLVGGATKYLVAWEGVFSEALAVSWFLSLPHLLEADNDLQSSFLLACNAFHPQSLMVLRTFLEDIALPLHFLLHEDEFEEWKRGAHYFVPRIGGKEGIAADLANRKIIDRTLAKSLDDLYRELGKAVHGAERHLSHME